MLILLGPPGAGKGTQAARLGKRLGLARVATGDLFRAAVAAGTELGREAAQYMDRGALVPDDVTVRMLLERLDTPASADGVILDGFPRTRTQAEALDAALGERGREVDRVLEIQVPEAELLARLTGRLLCRAKGHLYHEVARPPRVPGICDLDGSELYQREDDRPEVVRARLAEQLDDLGDVAAYYRDRGILRSVDGLRPIEAVTEDLLAALDGMPSGAA